MQTHGHREGSTKHWGLLGGKGEGQRGGSWGGIAWGEMLHVGDGGMEAANHHGMFVLMQQSYKFYKHTPELNI